ncbi:ImmA/IrrE family metallo-endopeptidase [Paenibacillus sp. FSL H7-0735]|uniref:ImmA/IrrE family metallo-endopeptidase n=1 Tax=Paenibacillus sp. FSL H7-0735 TaxID=2954736 RepID=UPI0030F95C84
MDLSLYWETPLEHWISCEYQQKGIYFVQDLDIDRIASSFNIDLIYYKGRTAADNNFGVIFLHDDRDLASMRVSFFHELGHVLRHVGDQRRMPELFRQLQEYDASAFMLYAAVPFYMLKKLSLPKNIGEAISYISKEFCVTTEIAEKRLTQVRQRLSQAEFFAVSIEGDDINSSKIVDDTTKSESSSLLRVRAFYDHNSDFSRPHTFVIESPLGFEGIDELKIDVNKNYKSCGIPERLPKNSAIVLPDDISIYNGDKGCISINISRVAWRHGADIQKLYLSMEAAEDALNF